MEIRKRLEGKAAGQNYKVYITPKGTHCWTKTLLGNNGRFVEHFAIGESLSGKNTYGLHGHFVVSKGCCNPSWLHSV